MDSSALGGLLTLLLILGIAVLTAAAIIMPLVVIGIYIRIGRTVSILKDIRNDKEE